MSLSQRQPQLNTNDFANIYRALNSKINYRISVGASHDSRAVKYIESQIKMIHSVIKLINEITPFAGNPAPHPISESLRAMLVDKAHILFSKLTAANEKYKTNDYFDGSETFIPEIERDFLVISTELKAFYDLSTNPFGEKLFTINPFQGRDLPEPEERNKVLEKLRDMIKINPNGAEIKYDFCTFLNIAKLDALIFGN